MTLSQSEVVFRRRTVNWITHSLWIFSLPIFAGLGILGLDILTRQGIPVLSWSEATRFFLPYALIHLLPVMVFSTVLRRACLQAFDEQLSRRSAWLLRVIDPSIDFGKEKDVKRLLYAILGSCIGLMLLVSISLLSGVLYSGPGGFAEVTIMLLVMWPLTVGYLLVFGLVAAAMGGLIGSIVYSVLHQTDARK